MLPKERLRELVGPDAGLSDDDLDELRQQLHTMAEVIVDLASDRLARNLVNVGAGSTAGEGREDNELQ